MNESNTTGQAADLESVMRRVKKLLAIAEDGRANAEEASAAAGMAERIMRKYQIEHADVIAAELTRGDDASFGFEDCGSSMDPEGRSEQASGWAGILSVRVAQFHDVQVRYVTTYKHGKTLRFQGYAADAQMARFTYVYLAKTLAAASRQFLRESGGSRRDAEAFRRGFNTALCASLDRALAEKKAAMAQASSSRALVIAKDRAVSEHFGNIKYRSAGRQNTRGMAFTDGVAAGSKIDVTRRGLSTSGGTTAQLR